MQPDGPYRYTHLLGGSPVGKAWAAVDGQGRFVTVAVLDAPVAATPGWREAFAAITNNLAQTGDMPFVYADFSAAAPWVAYPAEAGPGAERLFRALGVDYQPLPTGTEQATPASGPPAPVSGAPQPVSGAPQSVSGAPQSVSGPPQFGPPVSGPPSRTPHPVAATSGGPTLDATGLPLAAPGDTGYDPLSSTARRIKPSEPPKRPIGRWLVAAAVALLLLGGGGGLAIWAVGDGEETAPSPTGPAAFPTAAPVDLGLKPWEAFAPFSAQERSLAVAAPSLVFLEVTITGFLRDRATNTPVRSAPVSFVRRCTGIVVSPDGHVLTSSACVKPSEDTARQVALDAIARILVREEKIKEEEVEAYVRTNFETTRFTGTEPTQEPVGQVYGQLNVARSNLIEAPAIAGQIVRAQPVDAGNMALVKLAREDLPAAELNGSTSIEEGASLVVAGYASDDDDTRTATYQPRAKLVTVTDTGRRGTSALYRINSDVGRASHGGPALDPSGRVVGMIDQDQARPDRANRVVYPAASLLSFLSEAGVGNELSDVDRRYRAALDAYFSGNSDTAISELEAVANAAPTNLLAQAYRQNAVERRELEGEASGRPLWSTLLLVGAGAVAVAGAIVVIVMVIRRTRHSR